MFNVPLIGRRLSWYAGAWVGTFLLTLLACLAAPLFFSSGMVETADLVLPVMLLFLAAATALVLVVALFSAETLGTKLALLILGVVLVLPLLWAPVSGAVAAAFLSGAIIEYSTVYAGFRIGVSRALYPFFVFLFGGGFTQQVWEWFQNLSTVVGVLAGIVRLWPIVRRILGGGPRRIEVSDL